MKTIWKFQNSIESKLFQKLKMQISFLFEKLNFAKNAKIIAGGAPALRVPRAETWLTVYRSLPSVMLDENILI